MEVDEPQKEGEAGEKEEVKKLTEEEKNMSKYIQSISIKMSDMKKVEK